MIHDKPKVTIDLAEYNELIEFKYNRINLFHSINSKIATYYANNYAHINIDDLNNYLRKELKVNLVRKEGGQIEIITVH